MAGQLLLIMFDLTIVWPFGCLIQTNCCVVQQIPPEGQTSYAALRVAAVVQVKLPRCLQEIHPLVLVSAKSPERIIDPSQEVVQVPPSA